ncbi:dynein regulatory complex protein 10 [Melanotaenia boesemani]|uniref:dynein regulatory complex protein 10 n=1 Tax=Melanotaenia boesemani TaxID=1250792 RepID=UPI001C03CE6F|nr:dynein regulatory complex protein 10 [Melanotaenia boesemani]XP_041854917.1 dynein regulatory complex protein 10 [Melanotaenia boesemani]
MFARGATAPGKSQSSDPLWLEKMGLSPEAQYISNIIENSISRVEIAASLPNILQVHSLTDVDEDLRRVLQEHQILNEKLEKLEGLKQESEKDQRGEAEEASRRGKVQLEKDIKSSSRKVLRFFRVNPNAFFSLRAELDVEVGESESILIRALKSFQSHMMKMLISPDEEPQLSSAAVRNLEYLIPQEEKVATTLKKTNEECAQYEREIKDLQNYLKNIEEEDLPLFPDKPDQKTTETQSPKLTSLQQEIDKLNIQLKSLMLENRQVERNIQEKNEILRKEIENLIQVFDDKMEETQTKLDRTESEYANEQEVLKELEKTFPALEVKYNQILEKRRLAEEKIREEMKELELKTKAAIIAQSWWRGYRTRMALKNKGKGKKSKKGKGKKAR